MRPRAHALLPAIVLAAAAGPCLAAGAAGAPTVTHYVLDAAKSSLEFTFQQAGAQNKGNFPRFAVSF